MTAHDLEIIPVPSHPLRVLLQPIVMHGAFPFTLVLCAFTCGYAIHNHIDYSHTFSGLMLALLTFYVVLEMYFPYLPEWNMTLGSFVRRDAKFLVINTLTQEAGRIAIGWAAIKLAHHNTVTFWHPALKLAVLFLLFEFIQYWYHRWSHELKGRVGRFLWRVHAAHHLPERLYVMIHAIGHPLELLFTNVFLMIGLPLALGCTPEETFLFAVFANAIGIVSHLNVDLRLGWLNYVVVGPEAHRFHHSADTGEAKNYGAVLMVFDQLFKTFVYRPGTHPNTIGVVDQTTYPNSEHLGEVLALPFRTSRDSTTE